MSLSRPDVVHNDLRACPLCPITVPDDIKSSLNVGVMKSINWEFAGDGEPEPVADGDIPHTEKNSPHLCILDTDVLIDSASFISATIHELVKMSDPPRPVFKMLGIVLSERSPAVTFARDLYLEFFDSENLASDFFEVLSPPPPPYRKDVDYPYDYQIFGHYSQELHCHHNRLRQPLGNDQEIQALRFDDTNSDHGTGLSLADAVCSFVYNYTWPAPSSIDYFVGFGFNAFRAAFPVESESSCQQSHRFIRLATYLASLQSTVSYIPDKGAAVIDPHNYLRYNGNIISDSTAFTTCWKNLAALFKDNSHVIFGPPGPAPGPGPALATLPPSLDSPTPPTASPSNNNLKNFLGEIGAGSNDDCIAAVKGAFTAMQAFDAPWIGGLWWAARPWWGDYYQSMYVVRTPSAAALARILPKALEPFLPVTGPMDPLKLNLLYGPPGVYICASYL
ncbi:hypothetical protein FRC04_001217 [Tulasnella sp. 424]|nr:hypothetical protein FRC04_001217 [Tulasnella sp. 424]